MRSELGFGRYRQMPKSLRCRLISLVALFYGLCLVSSISPNSKDVCEGEDVQLFQNITLTDLNTVNLWGNGHRKMLIGTWNLSQHPIFLEGYKEKIHLDKGGTIWIRNIQLSEDGNYVLQYNADQLKSEIKVNVMVAPNNQCAATITKIGNVLNASLEAKDCGRPLAYVHWMYHPTISDTNDSVAILHPDTDFGTYIACAETPALQCVKNLRRSDYCSHFTIEGMQEYDRKTSSERPCQEKEVLHETKKDTTDILNVSFVMISAILIVVGCTSVVGLTIVVRRNKKITKIMKIIKTGSWMPTDLKGSWKIRGPVGPKLDC